MRKLLQSPLTWMVAAELVVVGALILVAWNVVGSAVRPVAQLPAVQAPSATDDAASPLPDLPNLNTAPARGPLPGLNVGFGFWRERLTQLNQDQAFAEQLEWQIVHSAEAAVSRYLQTVVLPAIQHAEHAGMASVS
jgi:hypothetical protein